MAKSVITTIHTPRALALVATALAAIGCSAETDNSSVDFLESAQVGRWEEQSAGTAEGTDSVAPDVPAATVAAPPATPAASAATAPPAAASAPTAASAPAPANTPAAANAPTTPQNPATPGAAPAATTPPVAATGAPAMKVTEQPPTNAVARLSYSVTTETYGGKYQPRNVGAVWVEDASGKLVKSLEVWTRTRTRYLTRYNQARGSARIDVLTSGTLSLHRAHQAMWDLKDLSGATVKPGVYKLFLEMTEDDGAGETMSVDIDTTKPAESLAPADAPGFTQLKVDLQ